MTTSNILSEIETALDGMTRGDFVDAGRRLLETLGYSSDRILELSGTVDDFIAEFTAPNPNTQTETRFRERAASARILFQLTDSEIATAQPSLLDTGEFDKGEARSFMFVAVALRDESYPRGAYVELTREINKRLIVPTVILFRTADHRFSVSFVHRRPHKLDQTRDVLGSVSLIREIDTSKPHRAHLDILRKLALSDRLSWMHAHQELYNFDGLLAAWLDALDTEELNRSFYRQLFAWFERAVKEAEFPTNQARTLRAEEHVIRLITRLLFVWFIKEKGLIAPELFIEAQIRSLLRDYDRENGDSYYRAVLQNLFFATLNSEIIGRRFSTKTNNDHREPSYYRYEEEIADPDRLLELFGQTPFINGGLFDCLDSPEAPSEGGYRIDCFSDNVIRPGSDDFKLLSLPNRLFFDEKGLITLFENFKFTVEENTPTEQEVALDPELLGKVFENLLAAYNPETRETARKQTGSYYTPRVVVDYMVDEALMAFLAQNCSPADGDTEFWKARLSYLMDYEDAFDDAHELFEDVEKEDLVRAVAQIKLIDPAVGSGAFPMGALHKLTLALRRLDPPNLLWKDLQKELAIKRASAAFDNPKQAERDAELDEISDTFEKYRDSDFGRKLYLIQNSIYGVDIQPIACQIAKLRFFISLAIEQEADPDAVNYGIKPLPNLETRFVAANSLIGLDLSTAEPLLRDDAVQKIQKEIATIREKYFLPNSRRRKLQYIRAEERLREQLERVLEDQRTDWNERQQREIDRKISHIPNPKHRKQLRKELLKDYEARKARFESGLEDAQKIARWNPYDQNAGAAWFDVKYMFGVAEGFDVVIGNPPYVESRNSLLSRELKDAYMSQVLSDWQESLPRGSDLLIYFYARAPKLLNDTGRGCFITQNAWLSTDYGQAFQNFSLNKFSFEKIIDSSAKFFSDLESQNINAIITVFSKQRLRDIDYAIADSDMVITPARTIEARQTMKWGHLFSMPHFFADILARMSANASTKGVITFGQGINPSMSILDLPESNISIIVKDTQFVAVSADRRVSDTEISVARRNKIPALIMPRGIGERYYCTFNLCKAYSYSHVEMYLPYELWESNMHYCLWAYLNSSLVWLFREITGRRNLGGGMLKAEATDMKTLPINFDFDFGNDAKHVFDLLKNREPLPVSEEIYTKEHLLIDDIVAGYFGLSSQKEAIRDTLINQVNFRLSFPSAATTVTAAEIRLSIGLVERILSAKKVNPPADTRGLQKEIDRLVYDLYGLTDEEIAVVEGLCRDEH